MELEKVSLVDEAYEKIKQKICDFELVPGTAISDFILSKELGMSRTPIRMALQKIENDGLIRDGGAGQSYYVCEITEADIIDLFNARRGIELSALLLAMDERRVTEENLERLRWINQRMEEVNKQGNVKQQFNYDQKFHDELVLLSGNTRIIRFHNSLLLQLTRMRALSYLERSYQDKAYRDHAQVIHMIESGDRDGAIHALWEHIDSTRENYISLLTNKLNGDSFGVLSFTMKHDPQ
ncbi:MAG: GntR family transcriptional regulator [Eubacteriales bacterium]|nr:GntR family transcriptional regulator [Eubacteriales bacterium]